ncbi:12495_t:CDS:1, partial [Ambispora leptoticha]
ISLEETEKKIREELTVEVCALLSDRLEYLCQIAQIEYREIGIETNIRSYFFIENYELDELAVKGSEIARRIIDIRSGHESDAVQNSIGTLKELINKEKSGDLETLHSDLRRLQDLIPVTEEGKTVANRQLTSAEIEAYRQNKKTADEKELELRKEIFRKEESSLGEER